MAEPMEDQLALVRSLREQDRALALENRALKTGGSGDPPTGASDDWKKIVEDQLRMLHEDFGKIIGWLIAAIAGPLLAIFVLYTFTGGRFDAPNVRIDALGNQISAARVEQDQQREEEREANAAMGGRLDQIRDRLGR